jgi:hypothetical protein
MAEFVAESPHVSVEEFKFSPRVRLELQLKSNEHVRAYPLDDVSSVPSSTVSTDVVLSALPRVQPPPTPEKDTEPAKDVPLVVTVRPVAMEENVIAPVELHTVPATNDIEPRMFSVGEVPVANVTVPAETVMSRQARAPVMVTV